MQRIQDLASADPNADPPLSPPGYPRVVLPPLLLSSQMLQLLDQVSRQGLMPSGGGLGQRGMHFVGDVTNLDNLAHNPSLTATHAECTHARPPPEYSQKSDDAGAIIDDRRVNGGRYAAVIAGSRSGASALLQATTWSRRVFSAATW